MAGGNVIRQDIVQVSFDVDDGGLGAIKGMLDSLTGNVQSTVNQFKGITQGAQQAASEVKEIGAAAQQAASESKGMSEPIKETAKSAQDAEVRLSSMVKALASNVTGKIKQLPTIIKSSATAAKQFAASLKANVADGAIKSVNKLKSGIQAIKKVKLKDVVDGIDKGLGKAVVSAKQLVSSLKNKAAEKLKSSLSGASGEAKKIKSEVDKGKSAIKEASKEADGLKSKFAGIGGAIAKGVGGLAIGAAGAAGGLIVSVVKSFGELEQNLGGAEAVFQNLGNSIKEMTTTQQTLNASTGQMEATTTSLATLSENAYKTMGISQSDYLATANKMGALFQGSGLEQQRSLDLTTQAMQRAADMASVMGIDQASAMEAVTGAAKGNYEMMDNLGVAMNATTLEAYAVSKGINKAWDSMSNAEKAELSMEYFFERTSQYAGNFEREATETISGSFGLLKASAQSFVAGLGNADADIQNLTNNMVEAFQAVVKNVTPILENLVEALPKVAESLLQAVGELLPTLLTSFTQLFDQVLKVMLDLIPQIIPALVQALLQIVDTIVDCIPLVADAALQLVNGLVGGIGEALPELIPAFIEAILGVVEVIIDQLPEFINAAIQLVQGLAEGLLNAMPVLIEKVPVLIEGLMTALSMALPQLLTAGFQIITMLVLGIIQMLPQLLQMGLNLILYLAQSIMSMLPQLVMLGMQLLMQLIMGIYQALPQLYTAAIQVVVGFIQQYAQMAPQLIATGLALLGNIVAGILQALPQILGAAWQVAQTMWDTLAQVDWLQLGLDLISALVGGIWEGIKSAGSGIWQGIKGMFTGEGGDAQAAGANTATSYSSGIKSGSGGISAAASSIATTAESSMKFDASALGLQATTDFSTGMTSGLSLATANMEGLETDFTAIANSTNTDVTTQFTTMGTNMQTETKTGTNGVMSTVDGMKSQLNAVDLSSTGRRIMQGLNKGMQSMRSTLMATAKGIATEISSTMNNALEIHSPSRVTQETGEFVDKGIIRGMKNYMPDVAATSYSVAETIAGNVGYADTAPMQTSSNSATTTNNYSPSFTVNLVGASANDDNKKKVKNWIKETLKEVFEDMDRDNPEVWEV